MKLADSASGYVKNKKSSVSSSNSTSVAMATASKDLGQKRSKKHMKNDIFTIKLL